MPTCNSIANRGRHKKYTNKHMLAIQKRLSGRPKVPIEGFFSQGLLFCTVTCGKIIPMFIARKAGPK